MAAPIRLTQALAAEYQQFFANCTIQPKYQIAVERLAQQLQQQQQRYSQVERATQVPWMIIAVIHAMESGLSFKRHQHNGDPQHSRTLCLGDLCR